MLPDLQQLALGEGRCLGMLVFALSEPCTLTCRGRPRGLDLEQLVFWGPFHSTLGQIPATPPRLQAAWIMIWSSSCWAGRRCALFCTNPVKVLTSKVCRRRLMGGEALRTSVHPNKLHKPHTLAGGMDPEQLMLYEAALGAFVFTPFKLINPAYSQAACNWTQSG